MRLNEKLQLRFAFVFLKIAKLRIYHESRNVLRMYVRGLILLYMVNRAFGDALGMYIEKSLRICVSSFLNVM